MAKKRNWEGSKRDLAEDKKQAKKNKMSLKDWEKSAQDKVHDREEADRKLMKRIRRATGGK